MRRIRFVSFVLDECDLNDRSRGRLSAGEKVEQPVRGVVAEEEPVVPRRLGCGLCASGEERFLVLAECGFDVVWVRSDGLA